MPLLSRRRSTLDLVLDNFAAANADRSDGDAPQKSPRREAGGSSHSDLLSPPIQKANPSTRRFSMLKWRHVSDSQLSAKARLHAAQTDGAPPVPDMPPAPSIITTAATLDMTHVNRSKKSKSPAKQSLAPDDADASHPRTSRDSNRYKTGGRPNVLRRLSTATSDTRTVAPPAYGDESSSSQALPVVGRTSVSSGADRSSSEHVTYASTTTHTVSTTTTTLFRLPRRNKRKSLFPLPMPIKTSGQTSPSFGPPTPRTPRQSIGGASTTSAVDSPPVTADRAASSPTLVRRHTDHGRVHLLPTPSASPARDNTQTALARSAVALAAQGGAPLFRNDSRSSIRSGADSPLHSIPRRLGLRDRSSTMSSRGRPSEDTTPATPNMSSARDSTSTSGRTSLGGFFGFNRFRHGSDSQGRGASPGPQSLTGSFVSREALVVPDREEGDTPGKYLERLQATVSRSLIAGILSKSSDPFAQAVLRSYCRRFAFFGEPIDMSLRKFLLEAELPKETQQVDRVVQAFADRYHECNPGIFSSPDQAYFVAFSLMMLHTDVFNKNNKRKMQRHDYVKNTGGQMICDEVLACLYDNISYTPFIHFDEDFDINGERMLSFTTKKSKLRATIPDPVRKVNSGPIDPYALICDGKLDLLRPSIKDSISTQDPYSYMGAAKTIDMHKLQRAFVNTAIIQIMSVRSRPAAFESQATRDNPSEAAMGVVDVKVTKVGVLWRKNTKRKKTRSPWQEWGAILTGSQLYLFRNVSWVKGLMAQHHQHLKLTQGRTPVTFKPPINEFKPDALIKTDDAVALLDSSYNKHKNAFVLVRNGGHEEVLLAESDPEVDEWLSLINYAAAFRSAGVRIRGFIGGTESDTPHARRRLDSTTSVRSSGPPEGEVITPRKQTMSPQLARQVMAARRQIMLQTMVEYDAQIAESTRNLETMLRNARHLQLLAPIQPKSREDLIHAAARMDAKLKWLRRDIWRTRCHRDFLALDLEEDGETVAKVTKPVPLSSSTVPGFTLREAGSLQRTSTASPPRSPPSPQPQPQETSERKEEYLSSDVFRSPSDRNSPQTHDTWKLPPLELDVVDPRTSAGRLSSVSTNPTLPRSRSTAGYSITSIAPEALSLTSSDAFSRITPGTDVEAEAVQLARDNSNSLVPNASASAGTSLEPTLMPTPESTGGSGKRKSGRRSLHRTLRESVHHDDSTPSSAATAVAPSSSQRHRRAKGSVSTVRSESGGGADEGEGDVVPGLERATGKFIVHGKQASVVNFDGDGWTEETLRLKREAGAGGSVVAGVVGARRGQGQQRQLSESLHATQPPDADRVSSVGDGSAALEMQTPPHTQQRKASVADSTPTTTPQTAVRTVVGEEGFAGEREQKEDEESDEDEDGEEQYYDVDETGAGGAAADEGEGGVQSGEAAASHNGSEQPPSTSRG